MKIMFSVEHPAWAHQFKYIVSILKARGDDVLVLAIDKDRDLELLDAFEIPYKLMGKTTGKGLVQKGFLFLWQSLQYSIVALRYKPDYLIGRYSPMMAIAAFFTRRRHIIYEDTEVDNFSLTVCRLFSDTIMTSTSFLKDLGPKQERIDTYKELFYLHPNQFTPDKKIVEECGINPDKPYIIMRVIAWNAIHDVGITGISNEMIEQYIQQLSPFAQIYISSEQPLPEHLQSYKLDIPYQSIHHVLAFAALYIGEGASMSSEAAVLGTHSIYLNSIIGGSTRELEKQYQLVYGFYDQPTERYSEGLKFALELLQNPNQKQQAQEKAQKMLTEKTEVNEYFVSKLTKEDVHTRRKLK